MAESYEAFTIAEYIGDQALQLLEDEEPPEHVTRMLGMGYPLVCQVAPEEADDDVWQAMNTVAHLGYFTRMTETHLLKNDVRPLPDEVTELLQTCLDNADGAETMGDALAQCAARFADAEDYADGTEETGSLSAVIPGQSARARMDGAYHTLSPFLRPTEGGTFTETEGFAKDEGNPKVLEGDEVIRIWLYGFFLRVFEEHYVETTGVESSGGPA